MAGESMTEKKTRKTKGAGCFTKIILVLVFLIIVLIVGVKLFFPAERIKAEIIKRSSAMLHREVELDDVSISIFPTPYLGLSGLRIYNPEDFAGGEFVSVDKLSCGLKFWPLLSGKFEFSEIGIDHPVIRLRKAPDGRVNYSFELDTGGEPIQTPVGPKESVSSEEAAMTAFAIDWAEITNGDLLYTDDSSNYKVALNNFSLKTRLSLDPDGTKGRSTGTLHIPTISSELIPNKLPLDLNLTYNADIDFVHSDLVLQNTKLEINGIAFDVEATIRNFSNPSSIFAKLKANNVSLEPLVKYIPPGGNFKPDDLRLQGNLTGELETRIELVSNRAPYFGGRFDFRDLTLGYQNIAGRLHFENLGILFDTDSVSITSSGGTLSGKPFAISGTVSNWDDMNYRLRTSGVYDIAGIEPFLDPAMHTEIKGTADFDLSIAGKKSDWAHTKLLGKISVDRLYYNNDSLTSPLERLDMKLTFAKDKVKVDSLYAEYPGVKMTLTGTMVNGFAHLLEPRKGYKKPRLDFALHSPLVNYDILLPEEEEPAVAPGTSPTTPGASSSPSGGGQAGAVGESMSATAPIFIPDIEAVGKIAIDTFIFREVVFSDVTGEVTYNDGLITYKNAAAKLYDGNVKADGTVDINDMYQPFVTSEFTATGIEANGFLTQFAKLSGHMYGKVDAKGRLVGRGSEPVDFIKSLNAESTIDMHEGRIVNFDLVKKLSEKFSFKTFEEEKIQNLITDIVIRDGKLLLDGTKVFNRMGDWNIGGTVAFIEKKLDLRVNLYLSEQYSKNMNMLGDLLKDSSGRVHVNFSIIGTYDKPDIANISTDNKVVEKKVEEKLKKEAGKLIDNLFKKK